MSSTPSPAASVLTTPHASFEARTAHAATHRRLRSAASVALPDPDIASGGPLHVQYRRGAGWTVEVEGTGERLLRTGTKRAAMRWARTEAKARDVALVEYLRDGRRKA